MHNWGERQLKWKRLKVVGLKMNCANPRGFIERDCSFLQIRCNSLALEIPLISKIQVQNWTTQFMKLKRTFNPKPNQNTKSQKKVLQKIDGNTRRVFPYVSVISVIERSRHIVKTIHPLLSMLMKSWSCWMIEPEYTLRKE